MAVEWIYSLPLPYFSLGSVIFIGGAIALYLWLKSKVVEPPEVVFDPYPNSPEATNQCKDCKEYFEELWKGYCGNCLPKHILYATRRPRKQIKE